MLYFRYPSNFWKNYFRYDENINYKAVNLVEQKISPEEFSISYPIIENTKNGENIFNINSSIINEVSELFKSQVLLDGPVDFNQVLGTYEVTLNKKSTLSILFSMYTYINRAAHGFTKYSSITINTKTGHIYEFSELFNSKVNYKTFLDEIAQQYIENNDITLISEYNGITENQQYYLTPDSLVIYYQIYEYTPYVHGLFKIEIPYYKIRDIINPLGPIAGIIK